ncbi:hypothetical protein D3C87_1366720 [compost metagenome]
MNCKPGDLAQIVAPYDEKGRGHFVTVVRRAKRRERLGGCDFVHASPVPGWVCDGSVPMWDGFIARRLVIADECLRPIRDPGDDAVDESAAWLPPVPLPAIDPSLIPEKESA